LGGEGRGWGRPVAALSRSRRWSSPNRASLFLSFAKGFERAPFSSIRENHKFDVRTLPHESRVPPGVSLAAVVVPRGSTAMSTTRSTHEQAASGSKTRHLEEIAAAVRIVASGEALLAPAGTRAMIEEFARREPTAATILPPAVSELTPRSARCSTSSPRPLKPGTARDQRGHRDHARSPDPPEARPPRPRPVGDLRLRDRRCHTPGQRLRIGAVGGRPLTIS
jgi:hypothetical protein